MSVITEKSDITTSYLLIQRARPGDSGKYICRLSDFFIIQRRLFGNAVEALLGDESFRKGLVDVVE